MLVLAMGCSGRQDEDVEAAADSTASASILCFLAGGGSEGGEEAWSETGMMVV